MTHGPHDTNAASMSLAVKAARGAVWTILAAVAGRALGVIGTLIITRFLHPDIIGEVGSALVIVLTINWLTNIGFGQYVIVRGRTEPGPEVVWHANVASVGLGWFGLALVALFADPVAWLVNSDNAGQYIPLLALTIGLRRVAAIPEKLLIRSMHFRAISIAYALGEATHAAVTVAFAAGGFGGMAVVYGILAQYALVTVIIVTAAGRTWLERTPLRLARFRDMFHFGWPLAMEALASNASRFWGTLAVRRLFGASATGVYTLAYSLADIPAIYVGEQIGMVLLPSLAQLEPERRPRALVRSTALLSLIIFPMAIGLGVVAEPLIELLLSDAWQGVAPLLTILVVLSVFRPVAWVVSSYLLTQERNRPLMFLELGKTAILLGGMVALAPFGIEWAAVAVGIAFGLHAVASVALVLRDGPSPAELLGGFVRPLVACAAMAGAVLGVRQLLASTVELHPGIRLAIECTVGAAVYVPVALIVCRETARDLIGLMKDVVRRRRD